MIHLLSFLPLISYCLVMSGTPGPNNVMLATCGANYGYREAVPAMLGIQAGGFMLTFICCMGLGSIFNLYPVLQQILQICGAVYLLYLAWKLSFVAAKEGQLKQAFSFSEAVFFQLINPKSWIKAITLASIFMPAGMSPLSGALLLGITGSVIGLPCSMMWVLFGMSIRTLLKDPFKQRIFNLSMGAVLVILAIRFLC